MEIKRFFESVFLDRFLPLSVVEPLLRKITGVRNCKIGVAEQLVMMFTAFVMFLLEISRVIRRSEGCRCLVHRPRIVDQACFENLVQYFKMRTVLHNLFPQRLRASVS